MHPERTTIVARPEQLADATWVRLAGAVRFESCREGQVVLTHEYSGKRIKVSQRLHGTLVKLRTPTLIADLLTSLPQLEPALTTLFERSFLIDAMREESPRPRRQLGASACTLFQCPRLTETADAHEIVVLGVPFDQGSTVVGGQRRGPAELRVATQENAYEIDRDTGRPLGWYDVDASTRILEGVRMADAGDFCFEYGEEASSIYKRLGDTWQALRRDGALAVTIGGDHSITFPLVEQLQRHQDVTVVWFDAHTDESYCREGQSHHYGNVLSRILALKGVRQVVRVGTRGFTSNRRMVFDSDRCRTISVSTLRQFGVAAILDAMPPGLPCYVSIDLDVLDPSIAPAVGTPVPGGLLLGELEEAIEAVALAFRVEALDLVELNPDRASGSLTAGVANRLLLKSLHSVMMGRFRNDAHVPSTDPVSQLFPV